MYLIIPTLALIYIDNFEAATDFLVLVLLASSDGLGAHSGVFISSFV